MQSSRPKSALAPAFVDHNTKRPTEAHLAGPLRPASVPAAEGSPLPAAVSLLEQQNLQLLLQQTLHAWLMRGEQGERQGQGRPCPGQSVSAGQRHGGDA
eukprot:57196-Pelagomonas_calceolata.AAC.4